MVATAKNVPVVRARLNGCLYTLPLSTGLSNTPYPTPGCDSCMITFAAGNSIDAGLTRSTSLAGECFIAQQILYSGHVSRRASRAAGIALGCALDRQFGDP